MWHKIAVQEKADTQIWFETQKENPALGKRFILPSKDLCNNAVRFE